LFSSILRAYRQHVPNLAFYLHLSEGEKRKPEKGRAAYRMQEQPQEECTAGIRFGCAIPPREIRMKGGNEDGSDTMETGNPGG
jgi:hypothetical protein